MLLINLRKWVCCLGILLLSGVCSADGAIVSVTGPGEQTILPDGDVVLRVTQSGTVTVQGTGRVRVLLVGGGGGGGVYAGGGGGGGGVVEIESLELTDGTYPVEIGAGGLGAVTNLVVELARNAQPGGTTRAFGYAAGGGGAGGGGYLVNADGTALDWNWYDVGGDGVLGGGGGGASGANTQTTEPFSGRGSAVLADGTTNDGAATERLTDNQRAGGGGGGAGGRGLSYVYDGCAPTGGIGVATTILGDVTYFGGGGSGGFSFPNNKEYIPGGLGGGGAGGFMHSGRNIAYPGLDADANSGGGGGGAGAFYHHRLDSAANHGNNLLPEEEGGYQGGNGADGIVVIRWTPLYTADATKQEGGTIGRKGDYYIHTFTEDDVFTVSRALRVDALIVGGGGAGGWCGATGGGGGGGVCITNGLHLLPGTYAVTVGAGGIPSETDADAGRDGQPSSFGDLTVPGGGAGSNNWSPGHDGASGGGGGGHGNRNYGPYAGGIGIPGFGHDGGANRIILTSTNYVNTVGGGGGGAGAPGQPGIQEFAVSAEDGTVTYTIVQLAHGGDGVACDFSGEEKWYGGGGGGGGQNVNAQVVGEGGKGGGGNGSGYNGRNNYAWAPEDGEPNTGGGGGGCGNLGNGKPDETAHGGSGGSGIVIIRYIARDDCSLLLLR